MELAARFHALFRGLERAVGRYDLSPSVVTVDKTTGKLKGRAITYQEPVTDELWAGHLAGKGTGIGIIPINDDAVVQWSVVDVDLYKGFDHKALEERIQELELPLVICRSKSGGAHCLIFLDPPAPAALVRNRLANWAMQLGFPGAEVIPKQSKLGSLDDTGTWLNMPYFNAADTQRYGILHGKPLSAEAFLEYAESKKISPETLAQFLTPEDKDLGGAPPCIRELCRRGVSSMRNEFLFNLAIYLRKRFSALDLDAIVIKLKEYYRKYIKDKASFNEREIDQTVAKSIGKKDYNYKCNQEPLCSVCNRGLCYQMEFGVGEGEGDVGVEITDLEKIGKDGAIYHVTVGETRIRLNNTQDLLNQDRFQVACSEQGEKVMNLVKRAQWIKLVQGLMEKVRLVIPPADTGIGGAFQHYLNGFCMTTGEFEEDILRGNAFLREEHYYFRLQDFRDKLKRERYPELKGEIVAARLEELGAIVEKREISGQMVTLRKLPASVIELPTESNKPRVKDETAF
jgi:hypothetical protein